MTFLAQNKSRKCFKYMRHKRLEQNCVSSPVHVVVTNVAGIQLTKWKRLDRQLLFRKKSGIKTGLLTITKIDKESTKYNIEPLRWCLLLHFAYHGFKVNYIEIMHILNQAVVHCSSKPMWQTLILFKWTLAKASAF